jgi:RNA polymerase sigma-70 factor (ECF subfamily)
LDRLTEEELVRAVIAGDKTAYAVLYDRFAPLVRALCYDRTGNLTDAQDLAQDVFLRAYQRLGTLGKPDRFGPWIVGIARRRCLEWRRQSVREQRRRRSRQPETKIAEGVGRHSENGQLLELVAALGEDERLAVHAFYLQEKSAEEARRLVGFSRSGFYKLLDRARAKLRQQLEQRQENVR